MIYGVLGDTHNCNEQIIRTIVEEEFRPRGIEVIAHTGDIEVQHVDKELFGGFPVLCVLTKMQAFKPEFCFTPENWHFVRPAYPNDPPSIIGNFTDPSAVVKLEELKSYCDKLRMYSRVISFYGEVIYLGHERSNDFFKDFNKAADFFNEINQVYDGVSLAITGHTHQQFFYRSNKMAWLNPGAVKDAWNGTREFAIYDSKKREAIFSRLNSAESRIAPVSVGILSDTLNVDQLDAGFWQRSRRNFDLRGVTHVILCGNFLPCDIGRPELDGLQVYYYLLPNTLQLVPKYDNWHLIKPENPVVEIGGHQFYVQHEIGSEQGKLSEAQRDDALKAVRAKYSHLDYIIAGLGPETVYMEAEKYAFINPGDARDHKNFAVVCVPPREVTLGTAW